MCDYCNKVDDHGRLSRNPETIKSQLLSNPDCAGTSLLAKYNPGSRETGYRERDKPDSRRRTHQPMAMLALIYIYDQVLPGRRICLPGSTPVS